MTYLVLVEPSDEQKAAFARWCLAQNPRIETVSASGSEVPADLFKDMPEELLVGAYVDGHLYRHVAEEVPLVEIRLPAKRSQREPEEVPVDDGPKPEPADKPAPRRGRVRQHPTGKAVGK